jgi:APA family basic amino acid/polyamine antiporter
MTLFDLVSMGVGATIGSGIFVMLGIGVAMTGRSVNLALIAAIFASFLMTIPAIFISGVAELKGGPVTQAAILLGKKWSSIIGYIYIIVNLTISVLAISIIDYL